MPVELSHDIDPPAKISVTGTVDLRAAIDIIDLVDLLTPEPVIVTLHSSVRLTNGGLMHLAKNLRRTNVGVDAPRDAPHWRFLLALVGVPTSDLADFDARAAGLAA